MTLPSRTPERMTRELPEARTATESERHVVAIDPASRVVGEPWRGTNDSQHAQERQEATSSAQESPAGEGDESPQLPFPAGAVEVRWQWPAAAAALPAESRAQLEREVVRVVRERWREAPPRVGSRMAAACQFDVRIEQLTVRVEAPPPAPPAPPREAPPSIGRGGAAAAGFSSFQLQRSLSGF
ncbi:MAG: hypothetical protein U0935_13125 [Pirellulales bacterium]